MLSSLRRFEIIFVTNREAVDHFLLLKPVPFLCCSLLRALHFTDHEVTENVHCWNVVDVNAQWRHSLLSMFLNWYLLRLEWRRVMNVLLSSLKLMLVVTTYVIICRWMNELLPCIYGRRTTGSRTCCKIESGQIARFRERQWIVRSSWIVFGSADVEYNKAGRLSLNLLQE